MYLWIWWLPLDTKASRVGQTWNLWHILRNSDETSLKSHLCSLCVLRKSASVFSEVESHWGERTVKFLLMAWCHNRWLSWHRDRKWVSPFLLIKAIAIMLSRWSCTLCPGLAYSNKAYRAALSSSQWMCFLASCSDQVYWKREPQSVLAPPAYMLASDQIWSVGFGGHHGLVLLALKPPEAHQLSSLTKLGW